MTLFELKSEIISTLESIVSSHLAGLINYFEDFSYNGFEIRTYHGYSYVVKNYKFYPRISNDIVEIVCEINPNFDLELAGRIQEFFEYLDQQLLENFGIGLYTVGRNNGWWGIKQSDAMTLISVSHDFEKIAEEFIKYAYLEEDLVKLLVSEETGINFDPKLFREFLLSKHNSKLLDDSKLYKCLDFIDAEIHRAEKEFLEDIYVRIKGV